MRSWGNYGCSILSRQQYSPNSTFVNLGCLKSSCQLSILCKNSSQNYLCLWLPVNLSCCQTTLDQELETVEGTSEPEKTCVKAGRTQCMDLEKCKIEQSPWTWAADTRVSSSHEPTASIPTHRRTIQWPLRTIVFQVKGLELMCVPPIVPSESPQGD